MDPEITRVAEETTVNSEGRPAVTIRVDFTVGSQGPFTKRFPKEGFDGRRARDELRDFVTHLADLGLRQ